MPEVAQHAPGSFCWAELATSDGAAAKRFYTTLFGWTTNDIPMGDVGGEYVIFQRNGRSVCALYENKQAPPNWLTYFSVTSVDDSSMTAKDLGANVVAGPMDVFDAGRMAVLADPNGAVFALWEARKHLGATLMGESNTLCWNELATTDEPSARKFYSALLPWEPKRSEGPMAYTEIYVNGRPIGGVYQMDEKMAGVPPHWMPYFAVDDPDAFVTRAQSLGGSAIVPPTDIPNVGRFAVLRDPQGAAFSIIRIAARHEQQ